MAVLNGYLYAVGFMGCTNIDLPALLKFNAEGDLVKKKIFDFDGRGSSIISYNDHIYITGTKEPKTNFLYKIDEDCKKISESYYLGNSGSCDEIIVHNGNIFVVFEESHTDPYNEKYSSEIFLQKFDLNCNPLWDVAKKIAVSPYLDSYLNLPEGIAANGDYIYFCGSILDMSNLPFYKVDVFLVKYNVALEKEDWVKIWDNDKEDLASDLVMDNEGYLYVTGSTGNEVLNGRTSIFLLKCDRNGEGEFKERTIENKKLLNRWLQNMVGKWDFPLLQRLLNQLSKPR